MVYPSFMNAKSQHKIINIITNIQVQEAYIIGIDCHHKKIDDTPEFQNAFDHSHYNHWSDRFRSDYANHTRIDQWFSSVNKYMRLPLCELQQKFDGGHSASIPFNIAGVK